MADIAVSLALAVVDKVSILLSNELNFTQTLQDDIKGPNAQLSTMQAYLIDMEREEGSEYVKNRVRQIWGIANEFLLQVPQHFHRHRTSQFAHEIFHFVKNWKSLHDLSSRIGSIKTNIDHREPSIPQPVLDEEDILGFEQEFHCHALVRVFHSCDAEELLSGIWKQFATCKKEQDPNREVGALRQYLQGKRYVVVSDDVWSAEVPDAIQQLLPKCPYGDGTLHVIVRLSEPNMGNVPELVDLSKQIAKKCEGLHLAITAVCILLSNKASLPSEWEKLHRSLGSEIRTNSNLSTFRGILLPNYSIGHPRLIRFWIAEGFVKKEQGKTIKEVADDYLNELIGRSLIPATIRDFDRWLEAAGTNLSEGARLSCVHTFFTLGIDIFSHYRIEHIILLFRLLRVLDLQGTGALKDLKKLSLINVCEQHAVIKDLEDLTQLSKLGLIGLKRDDDKALCTSVQKMSKLSTLDIQSTRK
ncbi:NB-ARC [Dillenia turbinata]|uniref:NB-ARC n=1 Tax=Dillenia turbinata TaxID=194707 RepID=A0AAN8WEA5_9MAGN